MVACDQVAQCREEGYLPVAALAEKTLPMAELLGESCRPNASQTGRLKSAAEQTCQSRRLPAEMRGR